MIRVVAKDTTARDMDLQDRLDDFLNGFRLWKDGKVESGEWSDRDEAFARWVEHDG